MFALRSRRSQGVLIGRAKRDHEACAWAPRLRIVRIVARQPNRSAQRKRSQAPRAASEKAAAPVEPESKPRRGNGRGEEITIRLPSSLFRRVEAVREEIEREWIGFPKRATDITQAIVEKFVRPHEERARIRAAEHRPAIPEGMQPGARRMPRGLG